MVLSGSAQEKTAIYMQTSRERTYLLFHELIGTSVKHNAQVAGVGSLEIHRSATPGSLCRFPFASRHTSTARAKLFSPQ